MPFVTRKTARTLLDMSIVKPVIDHAHEEALQGVLRTMARSVPRSVLEAFRPNHGFGTEQEPLKRWLALCGLDLDEIVVIPTNGSTSAMTVAMMTAAQPGDLIVSEEIGHHTLRPLARFLGLRLQGARVDEGGDVPAGVRGYLSRTERARPLYHAERGRILSRLP